MVIESPACVGFSFADTRSDCVANDTTSAADNYAAVLSLYSAFPELLPRQLFVAGES